MWWREVRSQWRRAGPVARLAVALAAASLTAGCFEPVYGARPSAGSETVRDKLAWITLAPMKPKKGTPQERISVGMHNALEFALSGGAATTENAATYRLTVVALPTEVTVAIDPITGRPNAQIAAIQASFQLIEIATNKTVISDSTFAHVDYDVPGTQQRFAKQRAQRDAEDGAVQVVADGIRNRLASYFVAGT